VSSFAIPVYVASAASTLSLQAEILLGCTCSDNSFLQEYLPVWLSSFDSSRHLPGKQPLWDRLGIQIDRRMLENSVISAIQWAAFLAATSQHGGDLFLALSIASYGVRLYYEAIVVRFGLQICIPNRCRCSYQLDVRAQQGFICKRSPGSTIRHCHLNELTDRGLSMASILSTKELQGLCRSYCKSSHDVTLVLWKIVKQSVKPLTWEFTVVCLLTDSYMALAARHLSARAETVASNKTAKYAGLTSY